VTTHNSAPVPDIARETIIDNVRAYRARRRLDQADVVREMRALGYTNWHRQTMSKVERGERRLLAEEIVGLAKVLATFPAHLLADGDQPRA
jgi:transcriptional regulator with XRE-family HTH domain